MRQFVLLACLGSLALSLSAAPLPESARPTPGANPPRPAALVDRDGDRVSDGLQAAVAAARPGELFRVVVSFRGPGNAATARQAVGFFVVHREFKIINGFAATMTAAQIRGLARQPGVFRIEEDFPVSIKLDAARRDFGADAARTSFAVDGTTIKGCIVDTGVDPNHEQFKKEDPDFRIPFFDAINGRPTAYDDHGHGTHVASIAFGDGIGGSGADTYKGVAPGVAIYAAKVLDQYGSGLESQVIAGIEWCVAQGAHIISMSLGSGAPSDGEDTLSVAANKAVANGSVVVAAAGNSGDEPSTVGSPGAAAQVITVAACADWSAPAGSPNHSNGVYLTPFSSRGPTLAPDKPIKPDICAPGLSITAAKANTPSHSDYVTFSGTSMATPFIAGAVALALQANPALSPTDVRRHLESTTQDRGSKYKDNDWGAGLVDVYAFVASAKGVLTYQPTAFPKYHQRISASVANHGLWTYTFNIAPTDVGVPIGIVITIDGQAKCLLPFFGSCLLAQWDPDLDAKLIDPKGVLLAESICMADDDCGGIGRQETLQAMPTVGGTYTIQVSPSPDSVNLGKGGSFFVDISTGPVASGASSSVVHVGDLDSSSKPSGKNGWKATVTITVHDANHGLVPNATVSGNWSGGITGPASCTTDGNGQCSVISGTISKRSSATFGVTNITGAFTYQAADNHEPDLLDNSNGTTITVSRP